METYRGRFAPSPTGPLHFGSLVAAVSSYVQARAHSGQWLVRMEDLDTPRNQPGAANLILKSLEIHGLYWDGTVIYQSSNTDKYESALDQLAEYDAIYPCCCSRKAVSAAMESSGKTVYPGTCVLRRLSDYTDKDAIRVKTDNTVIEFDDLVQGHFSQQLKQDIGDFVVQRADHIFAYQLAVVVDDAQQGITEIVRGSDLLDNTPRQIYLQRLLGYLSPQYMHVPVATNASTEKLSKQTGAEAIDDKLATMNLARALAFLGHPPPSEISADHIEAILKWSIKNWQHDKIPRKLSMISPTN